MKKSELIEILRNNNSLKVFNIGKTSNTRGKKFHSISIVSHDRERSRQYLEKICQDSRWELIDCTEDHRERFSTNPDTGETVEIQFVLKKSIGYASYEGH